MEKIIVDRFTTLWRKYMGGAELPLAFFYSDTESNSLRDKSFSHCVISQLSDVRNGINVCFDVDAVNCTGGRRFLGFLTNITDRFLHFISAGADGLACEKFKKTPDLVADMLLSIPFSVNSKRYLVVKRWDNIDVEDNPEVVLFFATPDILSGLVTLATFDSNDPGRIVTPFGSACASAIYMPYHDHLRGIDRATLGIFDPTARKYVKENIMTFSLPISLFTKMVDNMEESFLTTKTWEVVKGRINGIQPKIY